MRRLRLADPRSPRHLGAVLAKLAAPGMCNPDDATMVNGPPPKLRCSVTPAAPNAPTTRSSRRGVRCWHRVSWASTTVYRRRSSSPPRSKIWRRHRARAHWRGRAAADVRCDPAGPHAHHYLAIFDNGKALALYHTKRLASPGQRIVFYAKDRGCIPGLRPCPATSAKCTTTTPTEPIPVSDVNHLTLTCGPNHGHRPNKAGPPAKTAAAKPNRSHQQHLDHGQPRTNTYHHPEKLLQDDDEDDEDP